MSESTIIALAALAFSIASPFISTLLSNHHQKKMYMLEYYEKHRTEVIERYLSAVGRLISMRAYKTELEDFGAVCGEIYAYVPKECWDDITEINQLFHSEQSYHELKEPFDRLCIKLADIGIRKKR